MEDIKQNNGWFLSDTRNRRYYTEKMGGFCLISEMVNTTQKNMWFCLILEAGNIAQKIQVVSVRYRRRKSLDRKTGCLCLISEMEDITHKKQVIHIWYWRWKTLQNKNRMFLSDIGDRGHYKVKTGCFCLISDRKTGGFCMISEMDIKQNNRWFMSDTRNWRYYTKIPA